MYRVFVKYCPFQKTFFLVLNCDSKYHVKRTKPGLLCTQYTMSCTLVQYLIILLETTEKTVLIEGPGNIFRTPCMYV